MLKRLHNEDLYNPTPLPDVIYEIKVDHMWEMKFAMRNLVKMGHLENLDVDGVITLK